MGSVKYQLARKRRISYATCLLVAAAAAAFCVTETLGAELLQDRKIRRRPQQEQRRDQGFADIDLSFSEDESNVNVNKQGEGEDIVDESTTTTATLEDEEDNDVRIVGGKDAAEGDYPFFVEWNRGCGGTLIAPDLVLSAAHCYDARSNSKTVWVGGIRSEHGRKRTIVEARVHPQYNTDTEAYDFVVLRLNVEIRGAISPVTLNTRPYSYRQPADNEQLTVIGLGKLDAGDSFRSDYLQEVNVNYMANCAARSSYEPGVIQEDIMFCAGHPQGNRDACQGDSGGPILDSQKRQIGMVSFGRGCGLAEFPGVYSRISAVSNWLDQIKCMSRTHRPADCVDIRVDMTYDNYPTENGWTLLDRENQVIYQSDTGSVTTPGLRSTNLPVRQGSYTLEVNDKVGDGMCCVYGEGYFSVFNGVYKVESSGVFGTETNLEFEVRQRNMISGGVYGDQAESIPVSQNRVSVRVTVQYDAYPVETGWKLMNDETGALVGEARQGSVTTPSQLLTREYRHLSPGHYWFVIEDNSWDGICCRTGMGYVQIDQINSNGQSIGVRYYHRGDFGDFAESDFELA